MDHNLDDSLNLESDIASMDFDHSGVVVNQEDITLETTDHDADIPMELENIELQPTLMDTGNEEIIVSDFMNEQFTLQEYNTQDFTSKVTHEGADTVDANSLNVLTSHSDSVIDLKFAADTLTQSIVTPQTHEDAPQPKIIHIKAAIAPTRKKESLVASSMPRQVAIAPKPPVLTTVVNKFTSGSKQYTIAPKPVTLVTNKSLMKMAITGQGNKPGNAVFAQLGKQLVMVPASGGQKLKLVTASGSGVQNMKYAQLISTKQSGGTTVQKPLIGKIIVQGQSNSDDTNQPAMITKIVSGVSTSPTTRYVMQQKTVPISIGGTNVLMASPTKQGVELKRGIKFKKPIISLQSTQKNVVPVTSQGATTTKRVVITSNPSNVILKTTAPPKTPQVSKEGTIVMQGQKSQLHQINVPGKGIQYIRLITNPTPASKTTSKAQTAVSFVLADNKVTTKPQKKLVRIAPFAGKPTPAVTQQTPRSSQSLLAPLSPVEVPTEDVEQSNEVVESVEVEESVVNEQYLETVEESKCALRALLGDSEDTEHNVYNTMQEVEVEFETKTTREEQADSNSMMDVLESSNTSQDHPLIVIPSNYTKHNQMRVNNENIVFTAEPKDYPNIQVDVEGESVAMPYLSPDDSQQHTENEKSAPLGDFEVRPLKACNCTKSQCLKLYCDCFANGQFCNQCNCTNCHNNLDNEGLRQKAIRACLDRNPNAFRPKIGKSKVGGPEIIRRHNKGCNCKRSGCLKNYCECYEAKIACTTMCKCVGCRNVEETLERRRDALRLREKLSDPMFRPPPAGHVNKQPCSFMTSEVIEAVCQCLIATAVESKDMSMEDENKEVDVAKQDSDPMCDVIEEFARCLQDIISASHQSSSVSLFDDGDS